MTCSSSNQDSSPIEPVEHSHTTHEDSDDQEIRLNSTTETLQEIDAKFDSSYRCYKWWLRLMIIISGLYFIFIVAVVLYSMINDGVDGDFFILLLSVAVHAAFFAQYALEKWAISTKNFGIANLALKIITFFSVIFLVLNALAIYLLYDYSSGKNFAFSVDTAFGKALRTQFFIIVSIISVTQFFITHLQAIKVINDLSKRETIKASLQDPIDLSTISAISSV